MNLRHWVVPALAVLPMIAVMVDPALASTLSTSDTSGSTSSGSTQTLPWEGPLSGLTAALSGTTAKAISVIAIFIAGVGLIFGEDLGGFARKMLMIVIAAAFLLFAGSFLSNLTGTSGALI